MIYYDKGGANVESVLGISLSHHAYIFVSEHLANAVVTKHYDPLSLPWIVASIRLRHLWFPAVYFLMALNQTSPNRLNPLFLQG
ncbi:hypothetical protein I7I50_02347 [Histoplasma capsulatum G186AR]|uniref:Uncharacterized protein n=1 Tax=Ajellomyces capsulatus TaxID=5037 RepID=A0A8H7Z8H3_AJECA|nr:hypothetical protein I7I52_00989 [Histoplasma capsulatum]QSS71495.1 hypothetical protein I7I50_02347 [Histoplasma capsulatum G186AR]